MNPVLKKKINAFKSNKRAFIAFIFFFIYQMQIAWGGLEYVSDVLGISC